MRAFGGEVFEVAAVDFRLCYSGGNIERRSHSIVCKPPLDDHKPDDLPLSYTEQRSRLKGDYIFTCDTLKVIKRAVYAGKRQT